MNDQEQQKAKDTPLESGSSQEPALESSAMPELMDVANRTFDQIKRTLFDPRAISEKYDQEGGERVESEVSEARRRQKAVLASITEKEEDLKRREQAAALLETSKAKKVLALEQKLETLFVRLKKLLRIRDKAAVNLQKEVTSIEVEITELSTQAVRIRGELEELSQKQAEIPSPRSLLDAYYEKMETVPLSNEEKRELLRPEILVGLTTDEYIALWRRLNPHYLSHVTRQGFRDHNAMIYHSGGLEEFHDGLVGVLQDKKILRSPMAVRDGLRSRDEVSVRRFLEDWALKAENEEEAKARLNAQLNHSLATAPNYPDKTAVHFAAQLVADGYYGGERNNEVFFLYPSDVLASQYDYAFNGSEKDFTRPQSETKWNDIFVWPSTLDNSGIPVDAGIVFLPENTPVDPETGSKYASELQTVDGEEKRVMVEDEKLIAAFVEWAENLTDESPVIQAYKEYDAKRNDYWTNREDRERTCFDVFRSEIMKLGFSEEAAMGITRNLFSSVDGINQYQYNGSIGFGDTKKDAALSQLRSASANWKRAQNTIPAREYWEKYFEQHPEQRPNHIVFYDGDPTTAIHSFQQEHNIGKADVSETEGQLLGFDDRHIKDMGEDPRAKRGYDELVEMSHRIIEDHYGKGE